MSCNQRATASSPCSGLTSGITLQRMQRAQVNHGRFWRGFIGQSRSKSYDDPKNLPGEHCVQHATVQFRTDAAATPGTSTRRQTIGLIPSSQTLICTIWSASDASSVRLLPGRGCFGRCFIQPDYRLPCRSSWSLHKRSCSPYRATLHRSSIRRTFQSTTEDPQPTKKNATIMYPSV
jgi:hypothetical protein